MRFIGLNLDEETLLISRSLYSFYDEKYGIPKEKQYALQDAKREKKFSLEDIEGKSLIFVVYPELHYVGERIEPYNEIYHYLLSHENKELIYSYEENKVLIYKIENLDLDEISL